MKLNFITITVEFLVNYLSHKIIDHINETEISPL